MTKIFWRIALVFALGELPQPEGRSIDQMDF